MQGSPEPSYRVTAEELRQSIERLERFEVQKKLLLINKNKSWQTPKASATMCKC